MASSAFAFPSYIITKGGLSTDSCKSTSLSSSRSLVTDLPSPCLKPNNNSHSNRRAKVCASLAEKGEYYSNRPYELMIYIKCGNNDSDLHDFTSFKGIKELDKKINKIINDYKNDLYCIDFKWSEREDDFNQITI